jgi:hypothetical protein
VPIVRQVENLYVGANNIVNLRIPYHKSRRETPFHLRHDKSQTEQKGKSARDNCDLSQPILWRDMMVKLIPFLVHDEDFNFS